MREQQGKLDERSGMDHAPFKLEAHMATRRGKAHQSGDPMYYRDSTYERVNFPLPSSILLAGRRRSRSISRSNPLSLVTRNSRSIPLSRSSQGYSDWSGNGREPIDWTAAEINTAPPQVETSGSYASKDDLLHGVRGFDQYRDASIDDGYKLVWRPEPRTPHMDEAEKVWKMIDASLGRSRREESDERGQWVLVRTEETQATGNGHKAYRGPRSECLVNHVVGNALPSKNTCTPPQSRSMRGCASRTGEYSTKVSVNLRRTARVPVVRSSSRQSDEGHLDLSQVHQSSRPERSQRLHRLDSHIVQALAVLQADIDTPSLVAALELTDDASSRTDRELTGDCLLDSPQSSNEVGLGLGMPLRLDSLYSTPSSSLSL